mmetsp:Transcript_9566/g.38755  ORF Transcript_9566/g.38755 Transcript_9566/m.38755 type:complete len:203 (-) Transcript_9566:455-1063(-)
MWRGCTTTFIAEASLVSEERNVTLIQLRRYKQPTTPARPLPRRYSPLAPRAHLFSESSDALTMIGMKMYPSTTTKSRPNINLILNRRHHMARLMLSLRRWNCCAPSLSASALSSTAPTVSALSSILFMLPSIVALTSSTCSDTAVSLSTSPRSSYRLHVDASVGTADCSSPSRVAAPTSSARHPARTISRISSRSLNALRRG